MCDQLVQASQRRRRASTDFQKVLREVSRIASQNQRRRAPLKEKEFMDQFAESGVEGEKEERGVEYDPPRIKRDYYLEEVLAITVDYARTMARVGGVG